MGKDVTTRYQLIPEYGGRSGGMNFQLWPLSRFLDATRERTLAVIYSKQTFTVFLMLVSVDMASVLTWA